MENSQGECAVYAGLGDIETNDIEQLSFGARKSQFGKQNEFEANR